MIFNLHYRGVEAQDPYQEFPEESSHSGFSWQRPAVQKSVYKSIGVNHRSITDMLSKKGRTINSYFKCFDTPSDSAEFSNQIKSVNKHDTLLNRDMLTKAKQEKRNIQKGVVRRLQQDI